VSFSFLLVLQENQRADEQTRTAYTCSLRVMHQALQGCAEACKCRISRRLSVLRVALCCTVLRSRWYQSGIRSRWRAPLQYSCKQGLKDGRPQDGLGVVQPNPPDVLSELTVSFERILCQATQPTVPELISVSVSLVVGVSPTRLRRLHRRSGPLAGLCSPPAGQHHAPNNQRLKVPGPW
jgi:hypothetical protein